MTYFFCDWILPHKIEHKHTPNCTLIYSPSKTKTTGGHQECIVSLSKACPKPIVDLFYWLCLTHFQKELFHHRNLMVYIVESQAKRASYLLLLVQQHMRLSPCSSQPNFAIVYQLKETPRKSSRQKKNTSFALRKTRQFRHGTHRFHAMTPSSARPIARRAGRSAPNLPANTPALRSVFLPSLL